MADKLTREQVAKQCEAVAHMADALASIHSDYAALIGDWHDDTLADINGPRTARLMETLGDILNGMDAVDTDKDAWIDPVLKEAQRLWPQEPAS